MVKDEINDLIEKITKDGNQEEIFAAKKEFQKFSGDIFEDDKSYESRMGFFLEWFVFNLIQPDTQKTLLENYSDTHRADLSPEQIIAYENYSNNIHGIFMVKKIKSNCVVVLNLFENTKYTVYEDEPSIVFTKNTIFEGKIALSGDKYYFMGSFCFHPAETRNFIQSEIKKLTREENEAQKTLDRLTKELSVLEKKYKKNQAYIAKLNLNWDKTRSGPKRTRILDLIGVEEKNKIELERNLFELKEEIFDWRASKIQTECPQNRFDLVQKLSYMSLKWERSRQIDINDIYKI